MTDPKTGLGDPKALATARVAAHAAVQPLTMAARANLPAQPDDSHSNLEWSAGQQVFLTHPLGPDAPRRQVGLGLTPLRIAVLRDGEVLDELALAGQPLARVFDWVDEALGELGLAAASPVRPPYDLPPEAAEINRFGEDDPGLPALAAWFTLTATALQGFARDNAALHPGPSPVRCWPHHFDIATYVSLEDGEFETAKGVGVGLSPGDESYDQPYFYVNPWPRLAVDTLPDPIAPGHWHTEGFVGSIATGREILTGDDPAQVTAAFLQMSFDAGRTALGL